MGHSMRLKPRDRSAQSRLGGLSGRTHSWSLQAVASVCRRNELSSCIARVDDYFHA